MKRTTLLTCIAALLGCWAQAGATAMFQLGLPQLATGAERVVQAEVTAIVPRWNRDSTLISTYVRMRVVDDIVGPGQDDEIILRQVGGRIGTLTLTVEGTATYQVGETNVLFLRSDPDNPAAWQTLGMYQGKYRVYTTTDQVVRVTQEVVEGVALYKRGGGDTVETGNDLSLEEFKQRILQYRNGN